MNDREIARILKADAVSSDVTAVWHRHMLLCPHDDERCTHLEELIELLVSELEGFEATLKDETDKAFAQGQDETGQRLKDEHEGVREALYDGVALVRELKTAPLLDAADSGKIDAWLAMAEKVLQ